MLFDKMFFTDEILVFLSRYSGISKITSILIDLSLQLYKSLYPPLQARRLGSNIFKPFFNSQNLNFLQEELLETLSDIPSSGAQ